MTEIDRIEYATLQEKIRVLEEKIAGWKKQKETIGMILEKLEGAWSEAVLREENIQIKYGFSVGRGA